MPIYEYVCQDCGSKFEKFIRTRIVKTQPECPGCGSDHTDKAISTFASRGSSSGSIGGYSAASSAPACGPIG
jgi:putative FmdB family regulatory protein